MDGARMPLMEHLRELRKRFRNAVIALIVTTGITFAFARELIAIMIKPLADAWRGRKLGTFTLNYGNLTEPFWAEMKVSFYIGLFLGSPFVFYQLWKFVAPGLRDNERKIALPFAIFSGLFFCGGAVFCYFLVFPTAFKFFLGYSSNDYGSFSGLFGGMADYNIGGDMQLRATLFLEPILDFSMKTMLGFGLVFELPLAIYFLAKVGLVTHRSLWKFNKYWIVISFIIGAVLTPGPDVMSQILMATPLLVLYQISIVVAWVVTIGRERRKKAEEEAE